MAMGGTLLFSPYQEKMVSAASQAPDPLFDLPSNVANCDPVPLTAYVFAPRDWTWFLNQSLAILSQVVPLSLERPPASVVAFGSDHFAVSWRSFLKPG